MNKFSKIISSGSYLPDKILTNKELENMVNTSDEWITERTGIKERRVASENETSVDLAYNAAIDAIKKSNINKNDIGAIFLATCTPERKFPSTAVLLQNRLDIKNAFSFGCSITSIPSPLFNTDISPVSLSIMTFISVTRLTPFSELNLVT